MVDGKLVDGPAFRKELKDAYPFGPRQYHPYKIWLDEIGRQLGTKPELGSGAAPKKQYTGPLVFGERPKGF